jgi:hypothetical protein
VKRLAARISRAVRWRLAALLKRWNENISRPLRILREIHATTGRSRLGVGVDLARAWRKHRIDSGNFVAMLLWDIPRDRWGDFVVARELNPFLNATLDSDDRRLSRDKVAIAARDAALGLPWPPTLAIVNRKEGVAVESARNIDRKELLWPTLRELAREQDVVLKPACGRQGAGLFLVSAAGGARDGSGRDIAPEELADAVFSYKHPLGAYGYLVQEALAPAREMVALTGVDALASVRIVTAVYSGGIEFIEAFLKVPAPGRLVDNFRYGAFGTMIASIEPSSGRLTALVGLLRPGHRYVLERTTKHPATGCRIEASAMPRWSEAIDLSCRAARAHPRTATLGWDLALTPTGWVFFDFNPIWGPTHLPRFLAVARRLPPQPALKPRG